MEHSFDIDIAKEYGLKEAILIQHLQFWIIKNKANNKHQYDGYTWTYSSVKALSEIFYYLTEKEIRSALQRLVEKNVLLTGNYNKIKFDKTLWYAFRQEDIFVLPFVKTDLTKSTNGSIQKVKPIPDILTDNNTYNKIPISNEIDAQVSTKQNEKETKFNAKNVIDIFHKAYLAYHKTKPIINPKESNQAKNLANICIQRSPENPVKFCEELIRIAFEDNWFSVNSSIANIVSQINSYIPRLPQPEFKSAEKERIELEKQRKLERIKYESQFYSWEREQKEIEEMRRLGIII